MCFIVFFHLLVSCYVFKATSSLQEWPASGSFTACCSRRLGAGRPAQLGREAPGAAAPVWRLCDRVPRHWPAQLGRHSPRYLGQERNCSVYFLQEKKKKKTFRSFFFLKALSFRRNLDMLLFKKKSVCNVSVTRFVLSMIYVRKWFF